MPNLERAQSGRVSRRDFLVVAAVGSGAIVGVGLTASPAAAKMAPKAASYQPAPKGDQSCASCASFQPPASCKLVDGSISPSGWCTLYSPRK